MTVSIHSSISMKRVTKIPGILPPPPKTEIDGKITDLSSKTVPELLELLSRQVKLLSNKGFITKLPDRGVKLQEFHNKILKELKGKQEEEQTCRLFDNLSLKTLKKNTVEDIEWKGTIEQSRDTYLDSDDDSEPEDVMQILSQSTALEKKIKVLPPDKPLITPEDLIDTDIIPHVKYIVNKTESNRQDSTIGQFKPYKTTKSNSHNPEKELLRKKHKNWEVTAATPPPIVHGPVKVLSLEESLNLQKEHNIHLKEIEAKHAAEKLIARTGIKLADLPEDISKFGTYRDEDSDDSEISDPEGSDKEVHDDDPDKGGVIFTVMK